MSVRENFFFKSANIWQSYKQERDCLVHFARLANTPLNTKKIFFTRRLGNKPFIIWLLTTPSKGASFPILVTERWARS